MEPGAEYDALCLEIAERMRELVNPATGEKAVRDVWIRNDVYPGSAQENLPDVIVTWNNTAPISALTSASIGTIEQRSPDPRTGTHNTRSFLLADGSGIRGPAKSTGHLTDVAPTVMAMLGLTPQGMEGEPLTPMTKPEVRDSSGAAVAQSLPTS